MRRSLSILLAGLLAVPSSSFAQAFKILGTRPLGMGGAQVAVVEGAVSQYWNPAGLAIQKGFNVDGSIGAGAELTKDLLKEAKDVTDLAKKIDAIQAKTDASALSLGEYQDFLNALVQLNDLNRNGLGLVGELQGGGGLRVGRFAFSVNNFTEIGVDPFVDTVNMGLKNGIFGAGVDAVTDFNGGGIGGNGLPPGVAPADQAALASVLASAAGNLGIELPGGAGNESNIANELIAQAAANGQSGPDIVASISQIQQLYNQASAFLPSGVNPFAANQSNLTVSGASVMEAAVGLGGGLPMGLLPRLSLGGNVKVMRARVGYAKVNVLDENAKLGDLRKDFSAGMKDSAALGVDLGVLCDFRDTWARSRFGLVARNVNRPAFDQPTAAKNAGLEHYTLDPQVRAGWAWHPLSFLVVAADVDVTNNSTALPGYKSRLAGGGVELNVFNSDWLNLAFRGGLLKNIAESSSPLAYTGGFGLTLAHFYVDLGAAVSSKTVKIDAGNEIPSSVRVSANMGLRF